MGRLRVSGINGWALTLLVSFVLVGCGSDGSGNSAPVTSVQLSGIVVDGPVVAGDVRVTDADGTLLGQTTTDGAARFALEVPVEEATFPLTIVVTGGTNLVTGAPPEVALASFVNGPWENVTANVTPFSTLVVGVAERLPDGMTVANVGVANQIVREAMSFGLDASDFDQVVVVPILDGALPKYLKASEALTEMLRRTTEELMTTGQVSSATQVLESLQADLVDGVVDGLGAPGADDRMAAVSHVVTAQVLLESITNTLQVNGAGAGTLLDGALQQVLTVPNPALTVDSVMVTAAADLEKVNKRPRGKAKGQNGDPVISGTPPSQVTAGVLYSFVPSASDPEGDALSFSIQGKPAWATFDSNTGRLTGTPDAGDVGTFSNIQIEVSDGRESTPMPPFNITVSTMPNQAPTISGTPATQVTVGNAYGFTPTAADPDGDALSFSIQGRPAWATFNSNTGRLNGTPGAGNAATYSNIRITVTDGSDSRTLPAFAITVNDLPNQAPTISGTPATQVTVGNAYSFTPTAADPDGDALSFSVQGKPGWATFNSSTGRLNGTPGVGDVAPYSNIRITVTDGNDSRTLPAFAVTVNPSPQQDVFHQSSTGLLVMEAERFDQNIGGNGTGPWTVISEPNAANTQALKAAFGNRNDNPADAPRSEYRANFVVAGTAFVWVRFRAFDGGTDSLYVEVDNLGTQRFDTEPATGNWEWAQLVYPSSVSTGEHTIRLYRREHSLEIDRVVFTTNASFTPTGLGPAESPRALPGEELPPQGNLPPIISGTPPTQVTAGNGYSFTPNGFDGDGDPLTYSIQGRPAWASFNNATGQLNGTPTVSSVGTYNNVRITVSDGQAADSLPAFAITVSDIPNQAPNISGNATSQVTVGNSYSFTPTASDPDGDALSFSIQGKPSWASFNSGTGRLSGTPGAGNVGTYSNIRITASDGQDSSTLSAFTINVNDLPNQPPTISGVAATQVMANQPYSFTPNASDPDGDPMSFGIQGRPPWASFNSANGRLEGTPGQADIGTFGNIRISVTDGEDSAQLAAFTIEVLGTATGGFTLMWDAPQTNIDGSPLTDLAGYKVYLGTEPGSYGPAITINNPGVTTYVFDQLAPGTYYVTVTSVDINGNESPPSQEASATI